MAQKSFLTDTLLHTAKIGFLGAAVLTVGAGLVETFTTAAQSPLSQLVIKGAAAGMAAAVMGNAAALYALERHKEQELGVFRYMKTYATLGFILGGIGGYGLTSMALPETDDADQPATEQTISHIEQERPDSLTFA